MDCGKDDAKPMSWGEFDRTLLQAIDVRAECEAAGVRFTKSAPGPDGWLACHSVDRQDADPSAAVAVSGECKGRYTDLGGTETSCSFWDLGVKLRIAESWRAVRKHFAKKLNMAMPRGREPETG